MVTLVQKIWYSDGTTSRQIIEEINLETALKTAYEALDREVERQFNERGRVSIVKAICDEPPIIDLIP